MYTDINFKTKKALKEALAAGRSLTIYQPGMGDAPENGKVYLEGPHYPEAHRWYAEAWVKDGHIIKVV
jgi:hypothetical protein